MPTCVSTKVSRNYLEFLHFSNSGYKGTLAGIHKWRHLKTGGTGVTKKKNKGDFQDETGVPGARGGDGLKNAKWGDVIYG